MITIVSGLPRSGTSMMMQVLEAGGLPVLTDNVRKPDADNPRGYYELEKVKQIKKDVFWLDEADGKVFKMVSALLYDLPQDRFYKIIFMRRKIEEIAASQSVMLKNMGKEQGQGNDDMRKFFKAHLAKLMRWLDNQENMDVLYCGYDSMIENPMEQSVRIAEFLERDMDVEKMVQVVDPALYRQRV